MLIRVNGGREGIKDYLISGRKQGRDFTRDQMDERIILNGDLEITDFIISSMKENDEKDRYLHVTLAFKEDQVSRETMMAVIRDFEAFAFSGYMKDEYNMYAEGHLPKIKSYPDIKTGKSVDRLPHIHIVIPKANLLTSGYLNPFGYYKADAERFLKAFQEYMNWKYGLASPDDNRRRGLEDASDIVARHKGDLFGSQGRDLKARLLGAILDRGITRYEDFEALAVMFGEVRLRNERRADSYMNLKERGAAKGVNLKNFVFSREFIELSVVDKRRRLIEETEKIAREWECLEAGTPKDAAKAAVAAVHEKVLEEWHQFQSPKIHFVNSKKRRDEYKAATWDARRALLATLREQFYGRGSRDSALFDEQQQPSAGEHEVTAEAAQKEKVEVVQLLRDEQERAARGGSTDLEYFDTIKGTLRACELLQELSRTHGLIPSRFKVVKARDGGDRIKVGNEHLNVSDFLTQHMHLPWAEAAQILRGVHQRQQDEAHHRLAVTPVKGTSKALIEALAQRDHGKSLISPAVGRGADDLLRTLRAVEVSERPLSRNKVVVLVFGVSAIGTEPTPRVPQRHVDLVDPAGAVVARVALTPEMIEIDTEDPELAARVVLEHAKATAWQTLSIWGSDEFKAQVRKQAAAMGMQGLPLFDQESGGALNVAATALARRRAAAELPGDEDPDPDPDAPRG